MKTEQKTVYSTPKANWIAIGSDDVIRTSPADSGFLGESDDLSLPKIEFTE